MASWLNSEHRNPRWTYTKQQPNYRFTKTKTLSSSSGGESEFVSLTSSWPGWCCRSKICTLNSKARNQGQVKPPRIAVAIFKTGKRKLRQVLKSLVKMTMAKAWALAGYSSPKIRKWLLTLLASRGSHSGNITSWTPPFWTSPGKEDEIRPHSTVIEMLQEWDFWIN